MAKSIIFIVGLTGVGKSSTIDALETSHMKFHLLPNRRTLTDKFIIPQMQKSRGEHTEPVQDRLKRFELTAAYRRQYPAGMAYVVKTYIEKELNNITKTLVFDNLRGVNEVAGAIELFSQNIRFIALNASEQVRLQRLLGRNDNFDTVQTQDLLNANSDNIPVVEGIAPEKVAKALKIIQTEKQNYNALETIDYLKQKLSREQLCYLDTSELPIEEVATTIQRWL